MKIHFTFNRDKAECWRFSSKNELLLFVTNPFKLGFGYKRRKLNMQTEEYNFNLYRFTFKRWLQAPFGYIANFMVSNPYNPFKSKESPKFKV